jgi:pimeloyl-ACP methyl ester carboxylesterase
VTPTPRAPVQAAPPTATPTLAAVTAVPTVSDEISIVRQPLTLALDDGFKTKAEIDVPATGHAPFPAVLMLGGSGAADMDGATPTNPNLKIYKEMLDNLVKRGFIVYKFNKRGLDTNGRVINQQASDGRTNEALVKDGLAALGQFLADPAVDKNRVFLLGHSQGTLIAAQVARRAPVTIKGMILDGTIASWPAAFDYQLITRFLQAAQQTDTDKDGRLSSVEITVALNADQKIYENALRASLLNDSVLDYFPVFTRPGQPITVGAIKPDIDQDKDGKLSIEKELKPALQAQRDGLLTNPAILRNSGESATAIKSLLDGPKLSEVLPSLKIPVYFQHGGQDERAPLDPVEQVSRQLSAAGTSNVVRIYPNLTHIFISVDLLLQTPQQIAATTKFVPAEVLNDQASWLVSRIPGQGGMAALPGNNSIGQGGAPSGNLPASGRGGAAPAETTIWPPLALVLLAGTGGSAYWLIRLERRKIKDQRSKIENLD